MKPIATRARARARALFANGIRDGRRNTNSACAEQEFLSKDYRRQRKLDISRGILTLFQKNAAEH